MSASRSQTLKGSSLECHVSWKHPGTEKKHLTSGPDAHRLLERRIIILAPTGKDAPLMAGVFEKGGITTHIVHSIEELTDEIRTGAGAAVLSEEALSGDAIAQILEALNEQPAWSDFPVVLLTVAGRVTAQSERLRELRRPLGNIFLLERPIRPETLLATVEFVLRGRQRQYQIRDQMQQYAFAQQALLRTEKLAVAGRLAASIAHEINNPLEAVMNLLYLMRAHPAAKEGEMGQLLESAERELARVAEITKQTLRFYKEPSRPVETDIGNVLQSVLALFHTRITSAGITVETEVASPSAAVLSSPGELRQVIANIVSNAVDAMRSGGHLRIRVSKGKEGCPEGAACVRLTIADTGPGIPPEMLPHIFEPFVTSKEETGTGLGLWVTAEIIRKNKWKIVARSTQRQGRSGTVFSLTMPVAA